MQSRSCYFPPLPAPFNALKHVQNINVYTSLFFGIIAKVLPFLRPKYTKYFEISVSPEFNSLKVNLISSYLCVQVRDQTSSKRRHKRVVSDTTDTSFPKRNLLNYPSLFHPDSIAGAIF